MTETVLNVFCLFGSIQGESTRAGLPCTFVRLAGCPLRCRYCDTAHVRKAKGTPMTVSEIVAKVEAIGNHMVEVTGGEPLAQEGTAELLKVLCDRDLEVLLETSGVFSIEHIDPRVRVVLDVKTPDSGMADRMMAENWKSLQGGRHELKFVISSKDDFDWSVDFVEKRDLIRQVELLISPVEGMVAADDAAQWIMDSKMPFRLQLQLHKVVWPEGRAER